MTKRAEQIKTGKAVVMSVIGGVRGPVTEACLVHELKGRGLDRMMADEVLGWLEATGKIFETTIDGRANGFGVLRAWDILAA